LALPSKIFIGRDHSDKLNLAANPYGQVARIKIINKLLFKYLQMMEFREFPKTSFSDWTH